jgi:hypothetical protein
MDKIFACILANPISRGPLGRSGMKNPLNILCYSRYVGNERTCLAFQATGVLAIAIAVRRNFIWLHVFFNVP